MPPLAKRMPDEPLDAFVESVIKTLRKKESVIVVGFGSFTVQKRKARTGRNPQTGEAIKIKAQTAPKFRPGKALKEASQQKKIIRHRETRLPIAGSYRLGYSLSEWCRVMIRGVVVQLVRISACHAGGRGFESRPLRHIGTLTVHTEQRLKSPR